MRLSAFPNCCGIGVVNQFGNDPTHAHRPYNNQALADIEQTLVAMARDAATPGGYVAPGSDRLGQLGMLVCALNIEQSEVLWPILRRLGWKRSGKCANPRMTQYSEVFTYRKVLHNARD